MHKETTFKDFVEMVYKKPYDQISEKEIKETYREIFCFGLAKDDLPEPLTPVITVKAFLGISQDTFLRLLTFELMMDITFLFGMLKRKAYMKIYCRFVAFFIKNTIMHCKQKEHGKVIPCSWQDTYVIST